MQVALAASVVAHPLAIHVHLALTAQVVPVPRCLRVPTYVSTDVPTACAQWAMRVSWASALQPPVAQAAQVVQAAQAAQVVQAAQAV